MNTESKSPPEDFALLHSCYDPLETHFVTGLLESADITTYVVPMDSGPMADMIEVLAPCHKIFVHQNDFSQARKLIETQKSFEDDHEFHEFKRSFQKEKRRGAIWGRLLLLGFAAFLYAISYLPIKESASEMKYVCYGISLFLLGVLVFSFDWWKK